MCLKSLDSDRSARMCEDAVMYTMTAVLDPGPLTATYLSTMSKITTGIHAEITLGLLEDCTVPRELFDVLLTDFILALGD